MLWHFPLVSQHGEGMDSPLGDGTLILGRETSLYANPTPTDTRPCQGADSLNEHQCIGLKELTFCLLGLSPVNQHNFAIRMHGT